MATSPLPERMTTFRMPATRKAVGGLAVAVAVSAAGCGGGAGDGEETQPVPDATVFAEGGFDGLPRYPGAESVSEPAIKDDVTAQSFAVNVARPDRVMDFYAEELEAAGWTAVVAPSQIGADETYRGVWRRDQQELVVSSTLAQSIDDTDSTRTTQYSLSLGPA